MAGDRSTSKGTGLPPLTPRPVHKPTPEEVDRRGDEIFKKSIADLAQHLSERAKQPPVDLRTEAEKRRAAMLAYELARARRLKLIAGASGAAVAAACIAWFVVTISMPASMPAPEATASAKTELPGTQVETASLAPSPSPPASPAPPVSPSPPPSPPPSASAAPPPPLSSEPPAPPAPAPAPAAPATPPAPPAPARQAATSSPTSTPPAPPTVTASPPSPSPPMPEPPSPSASAPAPTPAPPPQAVPSRPTPTPPSPPTVTASSPASAPEPPSTSTAASTPVPTSPPTDIPQPDIPQPGSPQPGTPQPAVAEAPAAPNDAPLQRAEVREVQTKLYTFGFNPGPIDGADGPMTHAAIVHYEADRGLPQTGEPDRALLETLRQDPAPQVAAAPPPPRRRMSHGYARRSDDPFASIRAAGDRLGRWLQSLSR